MTSRSARIRPIRQWHPNRRLKTAAGLGAAVFALIAVSVIDLGPSSIDDPAPPAALNRIAARNDNAAAEAAARMKARSEAATRRTEARLEAAQANVSPAGNPDRSTSSAP